MINPGEWLIGPITEASADVAHRVLAGVDVEDTVHVLTRHGEVLGSYALNQHQFANESTLTVICERGVARAELHLQRWLTCRQPGGPWEVEATFANERDDLFIRQAGCFLDHAAGLAAARWSLAEALQTLRVNIALLESARTRRWVAIPA